MAGAERVVVVGAGQAGAATAVELRALGFDGDITLLGAEAHPPYERPPLSKAYLRGESERSALLIRPAPWWETAEVRLRPEHEVERIDRTSRRVVLRDGSSESYDWLVLAPGSAPRPLDLPGAQLDGVLTLRTLEDADRIRERARTADAVLVVGGGWIGSELTASLRQRGVAVTLAFPRELPLQQALGRPVAEVYDRLHRDHGAVLRPETTVVALEGDGRVRAARTGTGELLPADLVVAAVGATPRLGLAVSSGLRVEDGVVVDARMRTSDPRILAVGDVALAPYPDLGRSLRVEHWGTAQTQGAQAARTIAGSAGSYTDLPYFFSDQYETGMEFWGDPRRAGELVVRGSMEARSFTALWHDEGRVRAVLNMHVHHHSGGHGGEDAGHDHAHGGGSGHAAGGHDHAEHGHDHGGHDHAEHGHDHAGHDHAEHGHDHAGHDHAEHGHDHAGHDHAEHDHDRAEHGPDSDQVADHGGDAASAHGGAHLDPAVVSALIRSGRPLDVRGLGDPGTPLAALLDGR